MFFTIGEREKTMNKYERINAEIVSSVKTYARILNRKFAFRFSDIGDLKQELMCEALASMQNFDEQRGELGHFIKTVLKRRCATLIETNMRKKRNPFQTAGWRPHRF